MDLRSRVADGLKQALPLRARRRINRRRLEIRSLTAGVRDLPHFLVIGTERGGTSSLFKYLARHPEIAPSLRKETEYLNRHFDRGENWYRSHFQLKVRRVSAERLGYQSLAFEATPTYLQDPRVPARAAELLPDAKIIVLLRNPIARAISGWRHMTELGFEDLAFGEAIAAEQERLAGELDRMLSEPLYFSRPYQRHGYLDRGKYAEQLERWFEHFDRDRFLIIRSEDFFADPAVDFRRITDFLEIRPWKPEEFLIYSSATSSNPANAAADLSNSLREELQALFQPHNERLKTLLGEAFWHY